MVTGDAAPSNLMAEMVPEETKGLTSKDVLDLRNRFGYNDIPEEQKNNLVKFLSYFWGPIPWMIEAAAILSAAILHWEDFIVILLLLLTNAIVGFFQERKAENAIELLKRRLAPSARVLRDGTWQEIPARELVPGDVIYIRLGDIVPADAILGSGKYLLLDESALTGESFPVEKKQGDLVYSGSIAQQGEMDAKVTATGETTYFGRTARLIQKKPPRSHFQAAVERIGNYLIICAVVLVSVVITAAVLRSESLLDTLQFALILIVAAIPAALPAVMTVTLAVGAVVLANKEAIVSRLTAIEEMAGMDILCSDKTGTITQNLISVGEIRTFPGVGEQDVIVAAALASRREGNDPLDSAIFFRLDHGTQVPDDSRYRVVDYIPFDPETKLSKASIRDRSGSVFEVAKGAPQAISGLTGTEGAKVSLLNAMVSEFASKGFRALGVAKTGNSGEWQYLGLIGLFDPPREDSAKTVSETKKTRRRCETCDRGSHGNCTGNIRTGRAWEKHSAPVRVHRRQRKRPPPATRIGRRVRSGPPGK